MSARREAIEKPSGVILAGGGARRMGGAVKPLLPLAGKPLLQHVIDRVRPQVGELMLSVAHHSEVFDEFGLPQIVDPKPDGGPLGGLLAALQEMKAVSDWLLLVPCDAPFIPASLAELLIARADAAACPGALIRYESEVQPTFSVWNRRVLPRLERAVLEEGMAGFKQFLRVFELAELDWPQSAPFPFFNINDQDALHEAGALFLPESRT